MSQSVPPPRYCRPQAYHGLAAAREHIETTDGLFTAACCIAEHAVDARAGDTQLCVDRIAELSGRVVEHSFGGSKRARLAHIHRVLFDEERFAGNQADYYAPDNSFLPRVVETRRGIPISLALLYKVVAEGAGLEVEGIGAPGHFLVRVADEDGPLLIDPFHNGRMVEEEEAFSMMESALGHEIPREPRFLAPVTNAMWITRMLRNLEVVYAQRAHPRDAAAMVELRRLVEPTE